MMGEILKKSMDDQLSLNMLLNSLDEEDVLDSGDQIDGYSDSVDFWNLVETTDKKSVETQAERDEQMRVLEKLRKYIGQAASEKEKDFSFGEIKAEDEDMNAKAENKSMDTVDDTKANDSKINDENKTKESKADLLDQEDVNYKEQQTDLENRTKSIFDKVQSHLLKQRRTSFKTAKPDYMDKLGSFTGFSCPNCGRKFASEDYLKTHVDHCMNPKLKLETMIKTWVEAEVKNLNKRKIRRENGSVGGPCGLCEGCQSFCGVCVHCRLMPKFGGAHPNRNACQKRKYRCEKVRKEKKVKVINYDCTVCGKKYENLFEGQSSEDCEKIKHRALNHVRRCKYSLLESNFSCTLCDNKFKAKALLNTHIRRYHRKPFSCDQCDHSTGTNYDLQKHKNYKHNGKSFTCEICGQSLAYETGLRSHMKRVHSGTSFDCDKCDHSSNTEENLQRHKDNMHSGVVLECDMCSSQYHSPSALGTHIRMVHGDLEYILCDFCPFKSKNKNSLKKHKDSVHDKKQLSCKSCEFTSTQNSTILTHTKTVHQNIFFSCDQCKVKYPKKSTLQHHMEVKHGNGDMYQCDECPKRVNHKYTLQVHKTNHHTSLALNKQKCAKCDFSTTSKMKMYVHQGRTHNVTIKNCKECDYTTKFKKMLEDHVMVKHRGLGYICSICGTKKSRKQYLTEHMAKAHKCENETKTVKH